MAAPRRRPWAPPVAPAHASQAIAVAGSIGASRPPEIPSDATASAADPSTATTSACPFDDAVHGSTSCRTASSTSGSSMRTQSSKVAAMKSAESGNGGAGAATPSSLYSATPYAGSQGCRANGMSSGLTTSSGIDCPRSAHSWAMNPSRGPDGSRGRRSSKRCCWATTSVNGPIVNRPPSSSSINAAHSAGAHNAKRYSANVAAGHSCRPVFTAARVRLRSSLSSAQSAEAENLSMRRTSPSRSARCTRSSISLTPSARGIAAPTGRWGRQGSRSAIRRASASPRPRRRRAAWRSPAERDRRHG